MCRLARYSVVLIVFALWLPLLVDAAAISGRSGQGYYMKLQPFPGAPLDTPGSVPSGQNLYVPGNAVVNSCVQWQGHVDETKKTCVCHDETTEQLWVDDCDYVFEPATEAYGLGSGSGGGCTDLDDCFDAGAVIDGANSRVNAHNLGDGTEGFLTYVDPTNGPTRECYRAGDLPCNTEIFTAAGQVYNFYFNGTLFETYTGSSTHAYVGAGRPAGSIQWGAGAMFGDGSECDSDPASITVNGMPTQSLACPMVSSETDGFIYGAPIVLPGNFDESGDLLFDLRGYLVTDSGGGTIHGEISIDCVDDGEAPGSWSAETNLDLVIAGADVVNDEIHGIAPTAINTDAVGVECDAGKTLYWRYRVCDTDASPSSGCASSGGFENDVQFSLMRAEYLKNSKGE